MRLLGAVLAVAVVAGCGGRSELDISDADSPKTDAPCTSGTLALALIGTGCVPATKPFWCAVAAVGVTCGGLDGPQGTPPMPDCEYAAANPGGEVFYCCPSCAPPP